MQRLLKIAGIWLEGQQNHDCGIVYKGIVLPYQERCCSLLNSKLWSSSSRLERETDHVLAWFLEDATFVAPPIPPLNFNVYCPYEMKVVIAATFALTAASRVLSASDVPRPRGVGPEFSKHYKAASSFKCINNPDITLELSQVNDDYCDCPDGSDEPGTSACSHLNDTLALPGFYCKNKGIYSNESITGQGICLQSPGHTPTYVPFTHVNDGVCDYDLCCDGSDEWEGIGEKCPDKCKEIGQDWRKQNEQRQKALGIATKKRKELVTEAGRLKKEVEDRIKTLKTQITSVEIKVQNLEQEFAETEKREKARVVRAPKEGGKMGLLVTLAKQRTEELRTNLERVVKERDEAQSRLKELESMLTTFKEEYNPNFNDEGVKRAVRAWEDYAARDKPVEDLAIERELKEVLKEDSENGLTWTDYEHEESDTDVCEFCLRFIQQSTKGEITDFRPTST